MTTPQIEKFWAEAKKAVPGLDGAYTVKSFTANREVSEHLIERILEGKKFGTCTLPWLHGREPGSAPHAGKLIIYTDPDNNPRVLVRQKKPEFVAYGDITDAHTEVEGEGSAAQKADVWRKIHEPHYKGMLEPLGLELGPDMPVAVERFEVLYPKA
ncbi:MAG: ASCH domain-containing protein [Rhodobacteraceae bacterium]|nr:ASCH domain-containing protein [Paracoccaceae bacterium]